MKNWKEFSAKMILVSAIAALIVFASGTFVWLIWNWLMPELFGLQTITWTQALGLALLCDILFKSHPTSSK